MYRGHEPGMVGLIPLGATKLATRVSTSRVVERLPYETSSSKSGGDLRAAADRKREIQARTFEINRGARKTVVGSSE